MTDKERVAELVGRIRDQAKLHDPIASAIIELVRLSYEETKESLVSATGDDIHRLQGVSQHLRKLHRELTTAPPNIAPGAQ